jgi:hypothetical protein
MAVVRGTNCGFVSSSPTGDPAGSNAVLDYYAYALKDTSPSNAIKVVEIGWYCDNATEAANYEVAIYSHDAGSDKPDAVIGSDTTNAKGTTAGYWIGIQLDNTATATYLNYSADTGRRSYKAQVESLYDPWAADSTQSDGAVVAFYAVYETSAAGTNTKINISDSWKDVSEIKINIGDVWKDVNKIQVNIGDVWKTVFG